jgi:hypothetical protein
MPNVLPAISAFASSFGAGAAVAGGATGFWATIGGRLLASVALGVVQYAIGTVLAKSQRGSGIQLDNTAVGGTNPLSFQLGTYATAGSAICPELVHGGANKYLNYVIAVSDVRGVALKRLMINGAYATISETSPHPDYGKRIVGTFESDEDQITGTDSDGTPVVSTVVDNKAWIRYYDGTQTTADAMLLSKYPAGSDFPWSSDMIGRDLCYAVLTFKHSSKVFTSKPSVRFEVGGIPLYDPRKDTTVGGSGSHRWGTVSTYEASDNPFVQIYNILRGVTLVGGVTWGGGCTADQLPLTNWFAAMNACDALVTNSGGSTEKRYRSGIEVFVSDEPASIITELLKVCSGEISNVAGTWFVNAGAPPLPAFFFTDDDVIISAESTAELVNGDMSDVFNAAVVKFPEPDTGWEESSTPSLLFPAFESADLNKRLPAEISLPACPYTRQAQRVGREFVKDSRRRRRHNHMLPPNSLALNPTESASWTSTRNGYSEKTFQIEGVQESPLSMARIISMRERDPNDYAWSPSDELPVEPAPGRPITLSPLAVTGLSVAGFTRRDSSGAARRIGLRLIWSTVDISERVISIEWQGRVNGSTNVSLTGSTTSVTLGVAFEPDVVPATSYQVRARFRTRSGTGPWSSWVSGTSPSVYLTSSDMDDTFIDEIETTANLAGVTVVSTLPATGAKPNQIVMLVPPGRLYRWDATAGQWTTQLYAGIAPGDVQITSFASGIEPVTIYTGASLPTTFITNALIWTNDDKLYRWNGSAYITSVAASDLTGTLAAAQFANSLRPVEVVSSLPTTGNFQGRVVFLTTDNKLYRYTGAAWVSTVPAADITGQLVAGQIADAAITTAKFAAGIEPVEILATLPTTGNFQGRVVFLTTDNKLYRYTGSAFVASVAAGDIAGQVQAAQIAAIEASKITGQLTDAQISDLGAAKLSGQITQTQITDGSISTAKLAAASVVADKIATSAITADKVAANAITAVKIATGAVEAAKIAAGAVTAGTIAADAVTAGKIAAGAVTAGTIAADAVTAGKIAAGAVNAREIAADAITAEKLFIGDASNLVPNAEMTEDGAWSFGSTWYRVNNPTNTSFSSAGAFAYPDDGVSTGWGGLLSSKRFAVESGAKYYARHQSYAATGVTYRVWGRIAWMDTNGALIGGTEGVGYTTIDSSTAAGGGVVTKSSIVTAPVNAKFAQYHFYVDRGTTTGTVLVSGLIVRRASSGELIVDGAITADKIAANTITAAQIDAGAITADELAANSVVAGKVKAGAISTDELAAGAVTTEKLAVGSSNNTVHNSQFYGALSGWNATSDSGNTGVMSIRAAGSSWTKPGCPVLQVFQPDGGTVGYVDVRNQRVGETGNASFGTPVKEGSTWEASAYTSAHRCIVELRIEWRNVSGTTLGYSAVSTNSSDYGSSTDPDQWVRLVSRGIAPAGAAYAVFHIRKRATNSGASQADSFMMVHKPLLGETVPNASVAMEWSPGGWTLISGDAILTGSVTADKIAANTITAAQIATGAVTADELAANSVVAGKVAAGAISATEIAAGAITADKIAAGAITADKIAANTITVAQIATGAVTADELAANSVVAGKVAAGAISTDQLAAGAITAEKLAVGDFTNFVANGRNEDFTSDPTVYWSETLAGGDAYYSTVAITSARSLAVAKPTGDLTVSAYLSSKQYVPVQAGAEYYGETAIRGNTGTTTAGAYFRVLWYDADKVYLSDSDIVSNAGVTTTFQTFSKIVTAPAGACFARFRIYNHSSQTTARIMYFDRLLFWRANAGQLIVDGSITATQLGADSVVAGKIAAGAINAREIAAGAITAEKLAIANLNNACLDFDCADESYWSNTANRELIASGTNRSFGIGLNFVRISANTSDVDSISDWFAVEPNTDYYVQALFSMSSSGGAGARGIIEFGTLNDDGSVTFSRNIVLGTNASSAWTSYSWNVLTSPTEQRMRFKFRRLGDASTANARFGAPKVLRRNAGQLIVDGSITADKITTGELITTTAQLGTAVVSTAAIGNLAVTTAKIADLAVNTAKIANLAVTTGKIADLAVDTLQIAGEAVTALSYAYTAAAVLVDSVTTEVTIGSVTITRVSGYSTRIGFSCQINNPRTAGNQSRIEFRLYRGATQIQAWVFFADANSESVGEGKAFFVADTNTTGGSTTYSVKAVMTAADRSANISKRSVEAQQFKK